MSESILDRYQSLLPDPAALAQCIAQPLPVCIWSNPLKTTSKQLIAQLASCGAQLEPLSWYPNAFRSLGWPKPGSTIPFVAGWYYVQEEIALTAVELLDPQPGERVLDLCAAPGGKTAQIATRLAGTGTVIANEKNIGRLSSLSSTIGRLGLANVIVTNYDGRTIPLAPHSCDRVLVDVPCSGEGTIRKGFQNINWRPGYSEWISSVQRQILDHALQLVKPGGVVVYSTCTFAPEENEAVLDKVLGERGVVEPVSLPGLTAMPGLTEWQGKTYRADVAHAQRYFPHFNNTGGFFAARIRRTAAQLSDFTSPEPGSTTRHTVERLTDRSVLLNFCDRFGIDPAHFEFYTLWQKGKSTRWLAEQHVELPPAQAGQTLAIQGIGLPFFRLSSDNWKPSSYGLQRFGHRAQCQLVSLPTAAAAQQFIMGETVQVDPATIQLAEETPCYVHVRYGDMQLGCGRYTTGRLQSQIPKVMRVRFDAQSDD